MFVLEVNEDQFKLLFSLLDRELKNGGLNSLVSVVELHNVLLTAKKKEEPKVEEKAAEGA